MKDLTRSSPDKTKGLSFKDYVTRLDRRLILPWYGNFGLQLTGHKLYDLYRDPQKQLETALALDRSFEADFVNIMDDGILISETLGMDLMIADYDFPSVVGHRVKTARDLAGLHVPDPFRDGRMPLDLDALRLLAQTSPKPVVISLEGPFTLAGQLMGVPDLARRIMSDPSLVNDLLDFTGQAVLAYARAAVTAGVNLVSVAEPTAIILSPGQFQDLVLPNLERIFGSLGVWKALHICGDTGHLLGAMMRTGADALSLDQVMDLTDVFGRVPRDMVLFGNIDPVDVMLHMTPIQVHRQPLGLLARVREEPHFILSTGCDLSAETPAVNVAAFMEAGRTTKRKWASLTGGDRETDRTLKSEDASAVFLMAAAVHPLLHDIRQAVVRLDKDRCLAGCRRALEENWDALTIIEQGLAAGMREAGSLFEKQTYFVPELITAADVLYAGLGVVEPHLPVKDAGDQACIVLGVVEGDIHEIGKDLVAVMFHSAGWKVVDLGVDVSLDRFQAACRDHLPRVVGISALMSTTMRIIPEFIKALRAEFPGLLFMAGGAPITGKTAESYGADGYAPDAVSAVLTAKQLLNGRS